jgi:hypothetical protein
MVAGQTSKPPGLRCAGGLQVCVGWRRAGDTRGPARFLPVRHPMTLRRNRGLEWARIKRSRQRFERWHHARIRVRPPVSRRSVTRCRYDMKPWPHGGVGVRTLPMHRMHLDAGSPGRPTLGALDTCTDSAIRDAKQPDCARQRLESAPNVHSVHFVTVLAPATRVETCGILERRPGKRRDRPGSRPGRRSGPWCGAICGRSGRGGSRGTPATDLRVQVERQHDTLVRILAPRLARDPPHDLELVAVGVGAVERLAHAVV